jgi:hypothetical protein
VWKEEKSSPKGATKLKSKKLAMALKPFIFNRLQLHPENLTGH